MKFTKMHGCGNDYVYINCLEEDILNPEDLARKVSDRRFGIGSDGLVLIKSSLNNDFTMDMYNIDGSRGMMCGNAIRCVGKYVYEHGMTSKTSLRIDTLAGVKYLELSIDNGVVAEVTVDMGNPILNPDLIPVLFKSERIVDVPIEILDKEFQMTCVSVGNPHVVVFVDHTKDFEVQKYGKIFECHQIFPKQVNTEFVEVLNRKEINMRVWERGSGETFACGTGATASAYACLLNELTDNEVIVHMLGGDLKIRYDKVSDKLFMTGPAVMTFKGEM